MTTAWKKTLRICSMVEPFDSNSTFQSRKYSWLPSLCAATFWGKTYTIATLESYEKNVNKLNIVIFIFLNCHCALPFPQMPL